MKKILLFAVIYTAITNGAYADSVPTDMIHIVYRGIAADIKPGTFPAASKELWRAGSKYMRVDEAADPEHHIHGTLIVSEPDTWLWERYSNTAQHVVDPGPTFNVHVPVFSVGNAELRKQLDGLEMGYEKEFFASHNPQDLPVEAIEGNAVLPQSIHIGNASVMLFIDNKTGKPFQITLKTAGGEETVRYEVYDNVPFDVQKFTLPQGIPVTEAKQ